MQCVVNLLYSTYKCSIYTKADPQERQLDAIHNYPGLDGYNFLSTRKIDAFDNFASFFNRPLPHGKKQQLEKDLYC